MKKTLFVLVTFAFISCSGEKPDNTATEDTAAPTYEFSELTAHLQSYIDSNKIPNASAIVLKDGEVIYEKYLGFQDIANQQAVSEKTIYRLASLTKPIVSVAVLGLVDQGLLRLDDPLSEYLPAFKPVVINGSDDECCQLTIRQLLSHSAGLSSGFDRGEVGAMYNELYKRPFKNLKDYVLAIGELPLAEQPGKKFIYSHSPDVLAYLVEHITGKDYYTYIRESLLQPLEMSDTYFTIPASKTNHFAAMYALNADQELVLAADNSESSYVTGSNFPKGNTGLASTIKDYANLCIMLLNEGNFKGKQILKKETLKAFRTNQIPEAGLPIDVAGIQMPGLGFGLGTSVSYEANPYGKVVGTFGWIGGSHTQFFVDPENGIAGLLFSQQANAQTSSLLPEFNPLVYQALGL